jgi:hypothetical protein
MANSVFAQLQKFDKVSWPDGQLSSQHAIVEYYEHETQEKPVVGGNTQPLNRQRASCIFFAFFYDIRKCRMSDATLWAFGNRKVVKFQFFFRTLEPE